MLGKLCWGRFPELKHPVLLLLWLLALPAGAQHYHDLLVNDLANAATDARQSAYTTTVYQPAPNSLVLAVVINTKTSTPDTPTFAGNGLTWVPIGTTNFNTLAAPTERITMFRAQGPAPTSTGATADFGGKTQTGCIIQVLEFQGADATAANGANALIQTNFNGANDTANPGIAYASPSLPGTNAVFFAWGGSVNRSSDSTPQTNWVTLRQLAYDTPSTAGAFNYQMNALAAASSTNTASSQNWGAMMVEIKPGPEESESSRPTLVQYFGLIYEDPAVMTNIWLNLPNPSLSGNLLSLCCIHNYGSALTVTDDKNNQWTLGASSDDPDNYGITESYFFATNVAAGTLNLKLAFDTNASLFHADVAEFAHVAAYAPVDTSATQESTAPSLSPGAMTTTADGDLIVYNTIDIGSGSLQNEPASGFLGHGLRFLESDRNLPAIACYGVQAYAGSVTPGVDVAQTPGRTWMDIGIAYKRSSAGTLPSATAIRITRLYETILQFGTSDTLYLPFENSLQVLTCSSTANTAAITSVTDLLGNNWVTLTTTNSTAPQMLICSNAVCRNNPPNVLAFSKMDFGQFIYAYDIANASPDPLDTWSEAEISQAYPNADVTGVVSLTPTVANGLAIDVCGFGIGPPMSALGTDIIFDSVYYVGQQDGSHLSTGDGYAHCFYTSTSEIDFGFHMANDTITAANALGATFKPRYTAKGTATITLANLSQLYDGTARTVSVTTTPPGLAVDLMYNGLAAAPTNVGSYTVIGTVNDANYQGSATNILLVSFGAPYAGIDLTDPAQALADPDGDGAANLLEYALGTDPANSADSRNGMKVSLMQNAGSRYLALQFKQRNDTSGLPLQYVPEVSGDRQTWYNDPSHLVLVAVTPLDSVFSSITVRDLTAISAPAPRFIRLRAVSATGNASSPVWVGTGTLIQGNSGTGSRISSFSQRMVLPVECAGFVASLQGATLTDTKAVWADGQFGTNGTRAYVEFDNGSTGDIADSSASTQSLMLTRNLSGIAGAGDRYRVRGNYTIAGIFGTNDETGLKSGPTPAQADTISLLMPESQQTITVFYFDNGITAGWYASDFSAAGTQVVEPAQGMMVRRLESADLTAYLVGQVKSGIATVPVLPGYNVLGSLKSLSSPTLDTMNLYTGDPVSGLASGLTPAAGDNLLLVRPDGGVTTYFYYHDSRGNQGWFDAAYNSAAGVRISPGSAFIVNRKTPRTAFNWTIPAE